MDNSITDEIERRLNYDFNKLFNLGNVFLITIHLKELRECA